MTATTDTAAIPTHAFEAEVDAVGHGRLLLAGVDISHQIRAINVDATPSEGTNLTIYARPLGGRIVGEGIVTVVEPGRDPAAAVRALDPAEVDHRVAAAYNDAATDPTLTHLEVIAAMLDEACTT